MKMHPKPMVRHTRHVERVFVTPRSDDSREDFPAQIHFEHNNGATATLFMSYEEAQKLAEDLATVVRWKGMKAKDVDTEEWMDFQKRLKDVFTW